MVTQCCQCSACIPLGPALESSRSTRTLDFSYWEQYLVWRSRDRVCSLSSGVPASMSSLKIEPALERRTPLHFCVGVHGCHTCSFTDLLRYNPTQQGSFKISPFFNSAERQLPSPIVQYVWVTSQSFKSYYGEEENQREELKYTVCLLVWLMVTDWLIDWLIDSDGDGT